MPHLTFVLFQVVKPVDKENLLNLLKSVLFALESSICRKKPFNLRIMLDFCLSEAVLLQLIAVTLIIYLSRHLLLRLNKPIFDPHLINTNCKAKCKLFKSID